MGCDKHATIAVNRTAGRRELLSEKGYLGRYGRSMTNCFVGARSAGSALNHIKERVEVLIVRRSKVKDFRLIEKCGKFSSEIHFSLALRLDCGQLSHSKEMQEPAMFSQPVRSLARHVACAAMAVGLAAGPTLVAQSIIPIGIAYAAGPGGGERGAAGASAEKGHAEKSAAAGSSGSSTVERASVTGADKATLNADRAAVQAAEKALHADKTAGASAAQLATDRAAVQAAQDALKAERAAIAAGYAADRAVLRADRVAVQAAEKALRADRAAGASAAQIATDRATLQAAQDALKAERAAIAAEYSTTSGG